MNIEQIYTNCLAQGTYYITSNNEAIIIDPLRETNTYLDKLKTDNVTLKYIFETHFHADFVSGHEGLSKQTNAKIVYGPNAKPEFDAIIAKDEEVFRFGNCTITALHTPGHTMESTCYLLKNEENKEVALFSGDTLFLGDVGRPDLAQKAASITQEELAGILYESINSKILPLPNDIIIYPAHGAGSACGKNMMNITSDTLGNQKELNYALNQPNKESFILAVLDGLTPPPAYFAMNVALNKNGSESTDKVLAKALTGIKVNELSTVLESTNAILLDTRNPEIFAKGFVPNSINIGLKGEFAPWVGTIIGDVKQPLVLVTEDGMEEETIIRLARVGFDNIIGFLQGGFKNWQNNEMGFETINRISAKQFEVEFFPKTSKIIDVRKEGEYSAEHIDESYSKPLAQIKDWINDINPKEHFYIHCQGGYRSMITASILQAHGHHNYTEVEGGFKAIQDTNIPTTNFVCSSKVLNLN